MGLDNLLASDVAAVVTDRGEPVTYHPVGGTDRVFQAVIFRGEPSRAPDGELLLHGVRVLLRRSADPAIGVEAVSAHGDELSLPLRFGDATPTRCRIVQIIGANPGFFRVQVVA